LWCAVGAKSLTEIAATRWRVWPRDLPLIAVRDRSLAVADARAFARADGVGHVVQLELRPDRFARIDEDPLEPGELETVLEVAIMEDADYRAAIDDREIAEAERIMKLRFPPAWRAYLQRDTWFRRGWLASGDYVWLHRPLESAETWTIWHDLQLEDRPGMIAIGSDGGQELITLDGRNPRSAVTLTCNVSEGWVDSTPLCDSIEAFVDAVEGGTFVFDLE